MNHRCTHSNHIFYLLILCAGLLISCRTTPEALPASAPIQKESPSVVPPTKAVPTPDATPNAEIEAATQVALKAFWQAMAMDAFGPASAMFMDVYRGARQWVHPSELWLLHERAPDLFSAEPTFTILRSETPRPMVYLGGDQVLSYAEMTLDGKTLPLVVEVHRLDGDVRLSRLHIADTRAYSLPRSLEAGEYQEYAREPLDRSQPTAPMLLVESSVFLEQVRGALFFDGLPWQTLMCANASYSAETVIDVLGWSRSAKIEDYSAGLDDNDLVSEMRLKGTFAPIDEAAGVRFFEAIVHVSDDGWCLQEMLVDHNPDWALRGFYAAYGNALWAGDSAEIATFWCAGFEDQAEVGNGELVQFAFEPTTRDGTIVQVDGTRSDRGLFSAEMQYTNNRWCLNSLIITDPNG